MHGLEWSANLALLVCLNDIDGIHDCGDEGSKECSRHKVSDKVSPPRLSCIRQVILHFCSKTKEKDITGSIAQKNRHHTTVIFFQAKLP